MAGPCIAQVWGNQKEYAARELTGIRAYDMEATYLQWLDFRAIEFNEMAFIMYGPCSLFRFFRRSHLLLYSTKAPREKGYIRKRSLSCFYAQNIMEFRYSLVLKK